MATNNASDQSPTQYNVQVGGASGTLSNVAPSATSGVPLVSGGASANPSFTTATIAGGGTNATSMSTSTGIVKYDGTSLVTSSTALIDSSNRMTNTSQPCFSAYSNTGPSNVTGDGTIYTVVYDTEVFDQASNFSSTTFTAPVTGKYSLTYCCTPIDLAVAHTTLIMQIVTTLHTYTIAEEYPFAVQLGDQITLTGTILANMTAGDTAKTTLYVAGSTKTVSIGGLAYEGAVATYFMGYLVC
jgi:hypothetical protein